MIRRRVAIVGLGRLGAACGAAIRASDDLVLAGIVRRSETLGHALPGALREVPVASHVRTLGPLDAALVCLPAALVRGAAHDLLQHGPIVECAAFQRDELRVHHDAIDRMARNHRVAAVVGAGWDPGALSLFRGLFALLAPKGRTETRHHAGASLHHTLAAQRVAGVRDARCTEHPAADGSLQRYVYVELAPGADERYVADAIRADPLFLGTQTLVLPVESVAALEREGHGIVLARHGTAGQGEHQSLLLEARFDPTVLAAQVMVAAVRALRTLPPGAYTLFDVPLGALWGEAREQVARALGRPVHGPVG